MTSPLSLAVTTPGWCSAPYAAPVGPPLCVRVGYGQEKTSIRWKPSQIRSFLRQRGAEKPCPTFTFDAGYDPVQLGVALAGEEVGVLLRLRGEADLLCRSAPGTDRRTAASTWDEVCLLRSDHLARSYGRVEDYRYPLWVGAAEVAGRAPSHPPYARQAGHTASSPARPRNPHPTGGGASPQTGQSSGTTLALVVGTGPAGSSNHLAGVCRPVLNLTHLSLLQTGPHMNDPQVPLPRGGGPLDLIW
jgi:hypothetical protein